MSSLLRLAPSKTVGEADKQRDENLRLTAEIGNLRVENARLNDEIGRARRGQHAGISRTDLDYVMEHANCLLWHASIGESDDPTYLEWNVSPVRSDWAQSFFPVHLMPDEDYWEGFYRARLAEDLEPAGQRNAASIRAGLDYESEFRAIDATGNVRWIHESVRIETEVPSRVWRAVGFCTDITEQKEMQGKIERRDEILRVAADVAGVGLIVVDSEHRYRYANQKHGGVRHIANSDIVGKTVSEVFEPGYAAEFTANLERVFKGERILHHQIFESPSNDGVQQHFDVIIEPAADQSGPLAVVVLVDVTERDRIQEETRRLRMEAEKRATILDTARQVAHDILLSRSGAEVLRHIADTARQLAGAQYAAIAIDNAHEMELPQIIAAGLSTIEDNAISPPWLAEQCLDHIKQRPDEVWRSSYHPLVDGVPPLEYPDVSGAVMGIPIVRDGNAIGALFIGGAPGSARFDDAAESAVVALADYAAVAIHYQHQLKQQRVLTHSFVNLLEEERRSVAYELHDGLTQHIMAANAFLDSYCGNINTADAADTMNLDKGMTCLRLAVQESRRLINGLRALTLEEMGIECSLQQLLDEQTELAGWQEATFEHNTDGRRYGVDLETAVYRIAQEALSNVRKHAASDRVSIQLNEGQSDSGVQVLTLTVQDWGNGFDPGGVTTSYGHVGLQSMQERTRLLGGEFSTESRPGAGTRVYAVFELESTSRSVRYLAVNAL